MLNTLSLISLSLIYATISALTIFAVTYRVVTKSFSFSKDSRFPDIMVAVASGIMITILFLHLLREVYETNAEGPISAVVIALFVFFVLSLVNHSHVHEEDHSLAESKLSSKAVMLAGQTIHSIADGIVIISGWVASPITGLMTTLAIALHHIPMIIGVSNKYKSVHGYKFIRLYVAYTTFAMLVGIYFAQIIYTYVAKEYFLAIAAASFAHIAILDMFGHVRESKHITKKSKILFILIGIILAYFSEMSHLH